MEVETGTEAQDGRQPLTVRCAFCLKMNRVDLTRAGDRPTCGSCGRPILLDRPVKVTEEDFDTTVLGSAAPVLVDFHADWCAPCRLVAPVVDEIAGRLAGRLLVAKVDTDRAPHIAQRYRIRGIPTLILFRAGTEVGRSVGFDPEGIRSLADGAVA